MSSGRVTASIQAINRDFATIEKDHGRISRGKKIQILFGGIAVLGLFAIAVGGGVSPDMFTKTIVILSGLGGITIPSIACMGISKFVTKYFKNHQNDLTDSIDGKRIFKAILAALKEADIENGSIVDAELGIQPLLKRLDDCQWSGLVAEVNTYFSNKKELDPLKPFEKTFLLKLGAHPRQLANNLLHMDVHFVKHLFNHLPNKKKISFIEGITFNLKMIERVYYREQDEKFFKYFDVQTFENYLASMIGYFGNVSPAPQISLLKPKVWREMRTCCIRQMNSRLFPILKFIYELENLGDLEPKNEFIKQTDLFVDMWNKKHTRFDFDLPHRARRPYYEYLQRFETCPELKELSFKEYYQFLIKNPNDPRVRAKMTAGEWLRK